MEDSLNNDNVARKFSFISCVPTSILFFLLNKSCLQEEFMSVYKPTLHNIIFQYHKLHNIPNTNIATKKPPKKPEKVQLKLPMP